MKILVLNYEYPPTGGGGAPVSCDLAKGMVKLGHTVTVLTMRYGDNPTYRKEDGVDVYRLDCIRKSSSSCSPVEQLSYLMAVKRFMRDHREFQTYDVCHAHFIIPTGEAARYIRKKYGIPYIITAHGSDVEGHNTKLTMRLMHRVLRRNWRRIVDTGYCTVAPSEYLLDRMRHNYPKGRYRLIFNGVDYELFNHLNIETNKKKEILVMGRIQKFKNVQQVISAFSQIRGYDDWKLIIVGDGPYRNEIERLVHGYGINDRVVFWGRLENKSKDLLTVVSQASIYVSASQFENCPMALIEATIAGCYPLASNIPPHRKMLPEENLFELEDGLDLSNKLMDCMKNGARAYHFDMSRYNLDKISLEYERLMNACAEYAI